MRDEPREQNKIAVVHECIHCGKDYQHGCQCKFKKPPKPKWGGSIDLWTTVAQTIPEMFDEISRAVPISRTNGRKAIFKIQIHFTK